MALAPFVSVANNISSTINTALDATGTSIVLAAGQGAIFPAAPFYASVEFEVVRVTSKSGDTLSVLRAQDGTQATSHPLGSVIEMRGNAALWKDAYSAIQTVDGGVTQLRSDILAKTALPPDTTYQDNVQELTHKTIDLSTPAKANVIIGNVSPDPAGLNYANILINGGFDDWDYPPSTTLAAGVPASGVRQASFCNGWVAQGINDSAITVAKDTANTDSAYPSGYDCLINVSTVQAADTVDIRQYFNPGIDVSPNDLKKIVGAPCSISARIKSLSGNVQARLCFYSFDGTTTTAPTGPFTALTSSYSTIKFENQIWIAGVNANTALAFIQFKGVGQVAIDNVMLILGPVATIHRPSFPSITNKRLAPNVQRPNLLTNGGFEVWQRGPGAFTNTNTGPMYTADEWWITVGTPGSSMNVSRAGGINGYGMGTNFFGAGVGLILQSLEAVHLRGKPLTFSLDVIASSGQIRLQIVDVEAGISFYSPYYSSSNAVQRLSVTLPSFSQSSTHVQVVVFLENPCTPTIDNATLVAGTVPGDYVPMHPADDVARCLRYYEVIGSGAGQYFPMVTGYNSAGAIVYTSISFKAAKAVTPTITKNGTWTNSNTTGQPIATGGAALDGVTMQIAVSATGLGFAAPIGAGQNLTAEANP